MIVFPNYRMRGFVFYQRLLTEVYSMQTLNVAYSYIYVRIYFP